MIRRERWIPRPGLLERIAQRFDLGIFSGRRRREIDLSLRRFAPQVRFDPCIGAEDVADLKPAYDGLRLAAARRLGLPMVYVGARWTTPAARGLRACPSSASPRRAARAGRKREHSLSEKAPSPCSMTSMASKGWRP